MFVSQTAILPVTSGVGTVLVIRESGVSARGLVFKNRTSQVLSIQIEEEIDGTWTEVGDAFNIGIAGSGNEVVVRLIETKNSIRLRGSGGNDSGDLDFTYSRKYKGNLTTWVPPFII